MKRSLNSFAGLALTTSLLVATTACDKIEDQIQPLDPASGARVGAFDISAHGFDPMVMKMKIHEFMDKQKLTGYAFSIYVDGKRVVAAEGSDGLARKAVDAPKFNHAPYVRQKIASCSKYITTLAMMRMMERAEMNIDNPIWPYLPYYMDPSGGVQLITFRQLLSHHSGLVGGLNDIDITLAKMEQSVKTDNSTLHKTRQYNNMNFALCRVLLPYLYWKKVVKLSPEAIKAKEANKTNLDNELATVFLDFVRKDVFKPAGLVAWEFLGTTDPSNANPPMYYNMNSIGAAGVNSAFNDILHLGSGGFILSSFELAQIVSAAHNYKIVTKDSMKEIRTGYKNRPLGFDSFSDAKYGNYYYKNGGNTWVSNGKTGGVATLLADFDCPTANVQVAVVTNQNESNVSATAWLQTAFDSSWK
jgi:CubicO group peptidase (beta-lactamase class C family)